MILRDMVEADIEDYVRWFTSETEWLNWDAPWEDDACTEEEARRDWTAYYQWVCQLPQERQRWKFEIEAEGKHIGWVSAYTDLGELENPEQLLAIGLDIPEPSWRGRGYGAEAMRQMMEYYHRRGRHSFLTQTWSGNTRMVALAEKLGFREISRLRDLRLVNGKHYDALTFRLDLPEWGSARE